MAPIGARGQLCGLHSHGPALRACLCLDGVLAAPCVGVRVYTPICLCVLITLMCVCLCLYEYTFA